MLEDMSNQYSSKILHVVKDCYLKHDHYNNSGMNLNSLVVPIDSALFVGHVKTCLALVLPRRGSLARRGQVLSNWAMVTLLVARWA